MRYRSALIVLALAASVCLPPAAGGRATAADTAENTVPQQPVLTPLVVEVMSPPWAVEGTDGQHHLVYELRVSNAAPLAVRLDKVRVVDAKSNHSIGLLEGDDIQQRFAVGANRANLNRRLDAAAFGVLFVHVAIPSQADVPTTITHEVDLTFDPGGTSEQHITESVGFARVDDEPPVVLGPPLRGRNYIAGDGCCDSVRHIRALLPLNGQFWLAQRFAIDWEQIDDNNRIFVGDPHDVHSFHIYGKPVMAVADGRAVVARDGLADQIPNTVPVVDVADADGNHVIQDIGNGAYVLYAHMKPGSVEARVKPGQMLRKGQVIGLVGNTGNTTEPHLHLHVDNQPSGLLANGIPYVFERLKITGVDEAGTADFDRGAAEGTPLAITPVDPPTFHRRQLPLDLVIVDWLNAGASRQ